MMNGFDAYTHLLIKFPPRPIDSDAAYWDTQAVIDTLLAQDTLTDAEQDYLSLLGMLIEKYDESQQVFPALCGVALVKALMEELNLKPTALLPIFKTESIAATVLNGQRKLTIEQIEGLSRFFQLPSASFFEQAAVTTQGISYQPLESVGYELMVR